MQKPSVDLPNLAQPEAGVMSSGQPSREALENLCKSGCTLVINLRPPAECGDFDEAACARELGLDYHCIPVGGPDDLDAEAVEALDRVLAEAGDRPVLIHCASGNRVGALLALHAHWKRGMDPEQAIAYGDRAGLTAPGLRSVVIGKMKG